MQYNSSTIATNQEVYPNQIFPHSHNNEAPEPHSAQLSTDDLYSSMPIQNEVTTSRESGLMSIAITTKEGHVLDYLVQSTTVQSRDPSNTSLIPTNDISSEIFSRSDMENATDFSSNSLQKQQDEMSAHISSTPKFSLFNDPHQNDLKKQTPDDVDLSTCIKVPKKRNQGYKRKVACTFVPSMKTYEEEGYGATNRRAIQQYPVDPEDQKLVMEIWANQAKEQEERVRQTSIMHSQNSVEKVVCPEIADFSMTGNEKEETFHQNNPYEPMQQEERIQHATNGKRDVNLQTDVTLIDKAGVAVEWVAIKVENTPCNDGQFPDYLSADGRTSTKSIQTEPVQIKATIRKKNRPSKIRRKDYQSRFFLPSLDSDDDENDEEDQEELGRKKRHQRNAPKYFIQQQFQKFLSSTWNDQTDDEEDFSDALFRPASRSMMSTVRTYNTRSQQQKKPIDRFGFVLPSLLTVNDVTLDGTIQEQLDEARRVKNDRAEKEENTKRQKEAKKIIALIVENKSTQTYKEKTKRRDVSTNTDDRPDYNVVREKNENFHNRHLASDRENALTIQTTEEDLQRNNEEERNDEILANTKEDTEDTAELLTNSLQHVNETPTDISLNSHRNKVLIF